MKHIVAFFTLLVALAAFAGQLCVIDPPRPGPSTGFYVVGSKLYDPTGTEFRIHGVNRAHYDQTGANTGIPLTGANTMRAVINFTKTTDYNWGVVSPFIAAGLVPMPSNWGGTCSADPAALSAIVDTWVAQAPTWTKLNTIGLVNIANEWGPPNSTVWRDSYITAIARMRAAGYTSTLVVDSGYCGQDAQDIVQYGPAVLASDPLKNILFDVHVYSSFHYPATASWMQDYAKSMAAFKASGLAIVLGEFGPGPFTTADGVVHTVGASATLVPTATLVADAEANGFGWMAWAWDDNNLNACGTSYQGWFGMTMKCGVYTGQDMELTQFGQTIVPLFHAVGAKLANMH